MSDTPIFDSMNDDYPEPQPDSIPKPKVIAATVGAGVGSALATISTWIIGLVSGVAVPEAVELALGVVLTAGLAFIGGYVKHDA